jgi:hypothetical protein
VLALGTLGFALYVTFNAPPPSSDVQALYDWQGYGAVTSGYADYYLFWLEVGLYALALGSMFFYWKYGRHLLLAAIFLSPIRAAFGGIWVSSPLEDAFWALHAIFVLLVAGMALFHPPVRVAFSRHKVDADSPPNNSLERTREG